MPNRPVLNIKNFQFGSNASMVSYLLPTTPLTQDVKPYDVSEITLENIRNRKTFDDNGKPIPAMQALLKYLDRLAPGMKWTGANGIFKDDEDPGDYYIDLLRKNRWGGWIWLAFERSIDGIEYLLNSEKLGVYVSERTADIENNVILPLKNTNERLVEDRFPYKYTESDPDFTYMTNTLNRTIEYMTGEIQKITSMNVQEILNGMLSAYEKIESIFEYGRGTFITDWPRPEVIMHGEEQEVRSFRNLQTKMNDIEKQQYSFFFIVRCFIFAMDAKAVIDATDTPQDVKDYMNSLLAEYASDRIKHFESARLTYNRTFIEDYKSNAVEFPYLLDLGFNELTQLDLKHDTEGYQMHTIEREVAPGDEWNSNHTYGDRYRIRDMFRIDKLNKKSAFESAALFPGYSGQELDAMLELEDVVSRLSQNERDFSGIIATTATSDGMYVLSSSDDIETGAIVGTRFDKSKKILETNTFKSYDKPLVETDYMEIKTVEPTVNLQRRYGLSGKSHSSSGKFDEWYAKYGTSVFIHQPSSYSSSSILKLFGHSSYDFTPSKEGVYFIPGLYEDITITDDQFCKLTNEGVELRASIGDPNYNQSIMRQFSIEIPYTSDSQYSYVSLDFGFILDPNLNVPNNTKDVSIEFKLDNTTPIRYYFISGGIDNLTEEHILHYSLKDIGPRSINQTTRITLKIENDLLGETNHWLHIGITANYPKIVDNVTSELTQVAYKNTYVFVKGIQIDINNATNKQLTYGDYLKWCKDNGQSTMDFWNLSRSVTGVPYQQLLEVPSVISLNQTKKLVSNYKTADLFSDVITTKNQMDSEYRMNVYDTGGNFILNMFRQYTGVDSCSNVISLYYDVDENVKSTLTRDNGPIENLAQGFEVNEIEDATHEHSTKLRYKRIETIKSINRLTQSIRHKSNLFSVIINNSGIKEKQHEAEFKIKNAESQEQKELAEKELEDINENAEKVKTIIKMMTRNICEQYAPVHNQLFDVYFE